MSDSKTTTLPNGGDLDLRGDVQSIVQAAREHADPVRIDPTELQRHAFVVPNGAALTVLEPREEHLAKPRRLQGAVALADVESFESYVAEFYEADATTAWVDPAAFRVVAVLDDAHRSESSWREHRATLQLVKTPEWQRWRARDGVLMDQEAFARHIEISELDIVSPDAADLLEIAQTFYGTTSAEFRSATRLQSGQVELKWIEDTTAGAGRNGDLEVPQKFDLQIAPFHGEEQCAVTALFRYRLRDNKVTLGYELVRPDDVERDAMDLIATQLKDRIARVYLGSPA